MDAYDYGKAIRELIEKQYEVPGSVFYGGAVKLVWRNDGEEAYLTIYPASKGRPVYVATFAKDPDEG